MKLLFISDLHGLDRAYLDFAEELKRGDYDLGVLGGDLMTYPSQSEIAEARMEFRIEAEDNQGRKRPEPYMIDFELQKKENYYKQILKQSGKPIVFVMGNDDGIIGSGKEWTSENDIHGVNQRRIDFSGYNLVGYQCTNPFVGGKFERSEREQAEDL
jgi:Icc-related predicted phosphoesterase